MKAFLNIKLFTEVTLKTSIVWMCIITALNACSGSKLEKHPGVRGKVILTGRILDRETGAALPGRVKEGDTAIIARRIMMALTPLS